MPLYEYECDACHHRFEVIQKYSDPPIATCPKCGSPVQKLLSSPAIQFKGSGWYITDYARAGKTDSGQSSSRSDGSKSGETKSESGGESKSGESKSDESRSGESKSETKSESKTESKTESKSESKSSRPSTS